MRCVRGALLVLACLLHGAAAVCDTVGLTNCSENGNAAQLECEKSKQKEECCLGVANLENCLVNYGSPCGPGVAAQISALKTQITTWRNNVLSGNLGIECSEGLGTPTTTVNLLSGDSASSSGSSATSGRSGSSGYGFLYWQWVLLLICCCAFCAGGGGAGYQYMGKKKTRGKNKGSRPSNDAEYMQSGPVPIEQEMSGEPQLEMGMQEPLVDRDELPALQPIAGIEAPAEVQPLLFGPTPGLLTAPTASMITTASPGAYSYAGVLPTTTSQYTTGAFYQQAAQPIYQTSVLNAAQPTGTFGAFGTMPLGTIPPGGYVVEGQPTYVTTEYVEGGTMM